MLNHIKKIHLPYTVVDIGWWFQITLPRLPSGRIDFAYSGMADAIPGDGAKPSAFSDNRDVGKFVARAIVDPRTLNQQVFFFSEMLTLNQVYDLLERLSGESIPRKYVRLRAHKHSIYPIRAKLTFEYRSRKKKS